MRIFKKIGEFCVNIDNDTDASILISGGWIEMSTEEISSVFNGKESQAGPSTTSVDQNGLVTFTAPAGPSVEMLSASVRSVRDCRMLCALDATGKYQTQQALITSGGTVANAMTEQDHVAVLQYIEDLRNIPQQSGFPWNGPDDVACPWPTKPACVCDRSIAE